MELCEVTWQSILKVGQASIILLRTEKASVQHSFGFKRFRVQGSGRRASGSNHNKHD